MKKSTLRTKTVKAIATQAELLNMNAEELITSVETAIANFLCLDEEAAYNLMLRLKITPNKPESEEEDKKGSSKTFLEDVLKEIDLENIGVENAQKVCGDMAAAYKEAHPNCWLAKREAYPEELRKAFQDDATLMCFIDSKCKEASYLAVDDIKRILFLTSSEEEKYRFGGLRAMLFNKEQATIMKEFANVIGNYFKTFVEDKLKEEIPVIPNEEKKGEPVSNQNNSEAPVHDTDNPTYVAIPEIQEAETLTALQVLSNAEVLSTFFTAYKALKKAGIHPKLAIRKMDSIEKLLNAAVEL